MHQFIVDFRPETCTNPIDYIDFSRGGKGLGLRARGLSQP
jgi:hypothetical protein